jgi:hypothetical protein
LHAPVIFTNTIPRTVHQKNGLPDRNAGGSAAAFRLTLYLVVRAKTPFQSSGGGAFWNASIRSA